MTRTLLALAAALAFAMPASAQDLIITAVYDGPRTGGTPKGVELYVAADIADLSVYGVASANNGGGPSATPEFVFPAAPATAGDYLYVASEVPEFTAFFGFAPDYVSGAANINGDDAIELFFNGVVYDVFGDVNTDGTDQAWEYTDGWAYRLDGTGPSTTFTVGDWTYSGIDALDGETTNATAANPVPVGTYSADAPTSVTTSATVGWRLLSAPTTLTVDDLAQINLVSGAGGYTTGANCQVNGITNLFTEYLGDETANQNGGYVAPGSGATVEPGAGFFWYFFGDTPGAGQPAECQDGTNTSTTRALPIVLNADGTSGLGAGFPTVTIPDANDADGFYMLGNPYDTGYDVSAIEAVEAGTVNAVALQAGVQLWDPEIRGYVVYTADGTGDVTAADADDVSIWQGFFVERSGADPGTDVTFNFNPEGRQMDVEGDGFVARQAAGAPLLSFQVTDGTRTGAAAVVRFEEGADAAWDRFDLSKLAPFTSDFAQIGPVGQDRDGALVTKAVESLSSALNGSVDVPFAFTTSAAEGTFTVTWPRVELPDGWTATLADLVTGEATDLLAAEAYTFEHSASAPAERFVLGVSAPAVANEEGAQAFELSALAPTPTAGTARMALTVEASEAVTVQVYDALGRLVATVFDDVVTAGATRAISVPTASLSAGVYVVRVQGVSFAETRRLTVTR